MQWSGRILGIISWDPSVCKSNRLHVDIIRVSFLKLGYILYIPLKWPIIFLQSWTSTAYFSNSTGSSVTNCRFSPIIGSDGLELIDSIFTYDTIHELCCKGIHCADDICDSENCTTFITWTEAQTKFNLTPIEANDLASLASKIINRWRYRRVSIW